MMLATGCTRLRTRGPKQGTDLLDIIQLVLDEAAGPLAAAQIESTKAAMAADITTHVDLDLVAELLLNAAARP